MGFYKPVVKYLKMNKIYKIIKKKTSTHIFQPPAGLLIPGRKTEAELRGSCVWEKMKVKKQNKKKNTEHRCWVYVSGSERAGNWEHNPDYCQPRSHTKGGEKNKHIFVGGKAMK